MKKIVLMDFDGTITTEDTTKILLYELFKLKPLRLIVSCWYLFKMVISLNDEEIQKYKNLAIGYMIYNLSDKNISKALRKFKHKVKDRIRPNMLQKIKEYNIAGYIVLIVTASPTFAITYCTSELEVVVMGTDFKKFKKKYNGKIEGEPCYGDEKVNKINFWSSTQDFECDFIEGWGDSISDYPMLKICQHRYWVVDKKSKKKFDEIDPYANFMIQND